MTADNCLLDDSSAGRPLPVTSDAQVEDAAQKVTVFFGSDDRPHWLTKLVILHILGPDSPSFTSRMSGDQAPQTSRTHTRSEVISAWVRAGELSRLAGDHCSWQAIRAALCSRPIARLEKAWKRVDTSSLSVVESWIKQVQGFDRIGGVDVIMTPWGGDLHQKIRTALDRAKVGDEEVWTVGKLTEAKDLFEGFRTSFSLCPRKNDPLLDDVSEDIERLASAWKDLCISGGGKGNIASQFIQYVVAIDHLNYSSITDMLCSVDQFMSLSIAAESRRKGLYEPYFWSPSALSTSPTNHSLAPLLFPEHLPEVSLINRSQVWRGRLESGATQLSVQDVQFLRSADSASKLASSQKRKSLGTARDGLNGEEFGGTIIPIFDGELLLLIQPGAETSISPTSSRPPSRPSSSVIDPSITERPMSRAPSIRVKAGPHAMDRKASLARRSSLPSISQRASVVLQEHPSERPVRVVVKTGTLERLVEVLAHGLPGISVSIADDNGEMPLREGVARDIRLDRSDFASIWWNVYRSFVTPLVFFEVRGFLMFISPILTCIFSFCVNAMLVPL